MKAWIAATASACLLSSAADAQPMMYGQGTQNCGVFVTASEASRSGDQSVYQFMVWLSGYASMASGVSGRDYFAGADSKSVQLWMENYCRAHPLDKFADAAGNLLVELGKNKTK